MISRWGSRARGTLGEIPGRGSRFGHSGHVATRATSGETLPAVYSGHVSHSQASGGSITRWTSRRTRELPGGLRRTRRLSGRLAASALGDRCRARRLPGLALGGGFDTRGHVSCSEGDSERGFEGRPPGWFSGHLACSEGLRQGLRKAFGVTFGTRVILRKFPKEVPSVASKGAFGRASGRLRKGFRDTRHAPKGSERGCFGVARPEGGLRKGFREGASGWLSKGLPEGFPRGSSKEFPSGCFGLAFEGASRRVSSAGGPWSLD